MRGGIDPSKRAVVECPPTALNGASGAVSFQSVDFNTRFVRSCCLLSGRSLRLKGEQGRLRRDPWFSSAGTCRRASTAPFLAWKSIESVQMSAALSPTMTAPSWCPPLTCCVRVSSMSDSRSCYSFTHRVFTHQSSDYVVAPMRASIPCAIFVVEREPPLRRQVVPGLSNPNYYSFQCMSTTGLGGTYLAINYAVSGSCTYPGIPASDLILTTSFAVSNADATWQLIGTPSASPTPSPTVSPSISSSVTLSGSISVSPSVTSTPSASPFAHVWGQYGRDSSHTGQSAQVLLSVRVLAFACVCLGVYECVCVWLSVSCISVCMPHLVRTSHCLILLAVAVLPSRCGEFFRLFIMKAVWRCNAVIFVVPVLLFLLTHVF